MKNFRLLLAFGIPKSGTTFLQMILNAHPEISCPSEHQLEILRQGLAQLLKHYNQILEKVDQLTGKQGPSPYLEEDFERIFAYMVMVAALRGAQGKNPQRIKWFGLNDNAVILKLPFYAKLFPKARFVCNPLMALFGYELYQS
ncbi:MAG TPA: hypothetical protein EYP81_03265 [Thermodesulfobacteriaceae bacterium]|nr:hypothetical protein [Thermodesulfobacteriaceae bacterium]